MDSKPARAPDEPSLPAAKIEDGKAFPATPRPPPARTRLKPPSYPMPFPTGIVILGIVILLGVGALIFLSDLSGFAGSR